MAAAVQDMFQITLVGQCFNQRIMLSQHYRLTVANAPLTDEEAADLLGSYWDPFTATDPRGKYLACLSTDYEAVEVWSQKIKPVRMRKRVATSEGSGTAGASEWTNCACALQLYTPYAGRQYISVKKVGPIATGSPLCSNGNLSVDYKNIIDDFGDALTAKAIFSSGDVEFTPCIYNPNKTPNYTYVDGHIVKNTLRVNRRRTVGLGE